MRRHAATLVLAAALVAACGGLGPSPSAAPSDDVPLPPIGYVVPARPALGSTVFVTIQDESGAMTQARMAAPEELEANQAPLDTGVKVNGLRGRGTILVWIGSGGDVSAELTIGSGAQTMNLVLGRAAAGDLAPVTRGLVLTFSERWDTGLEIVTIEGQNRFEEPAARREDIEAEAIDAFGGQGMASVIRVRLDQADTLAPGHGLPPRLAWEVVLGPGACPIPCESPLGIVWFDAQTGAVLARTD